MVTKIDQDMISELGSFNGTTIPDNSTIKESFQSLETAIQKNNDKFLALDDFGGNGNNVYDNHVAITDALANSSNRVVKTSVTRGSLGKFLSSASFYSYLDCRFDGDACLVLDGKEQARNRSFITNEISDPDYSALENYFSGDWSKQITTNFTFVGTAVGSTPITQYRLLDKASQHSSVFVNTGGINTVANNQSGGRTGTFRENVRLIQGGQGDLMGRYTFAQAYSTRAGATHFLSCPAVSLQAADLEGLNNGNYLQAHEINFHDRGNAVAVGNVINYDRTNAGTSLYQTWKHDVVQITGTMPIDIVYSLYGAAKRYIDVTNATLTDGSVIAMKRGQRIHFDGVTNNDPIGINQGAIVNDTWIGADSSGNVVVNLAAGKALSVNSLLIKTGSSPYSTTLDDNTEWYIPEGFSNNVLGAGVDCGPAILDAISAASADGKAGVLLGEKIYGIGKSGMSTADGTKGVGLVIPDMTRVTLRGRGKNSVLKRISNTDYHVLEIMRATDSSVENLMLDGNATALPGSGVEANDCHCFSLNSGSTGSVINFIYRRVWHSDSQGYGAGLQFANYSGVFLEDLYFEGSDWDSIDIKHRAATPGPFVSEAIMMNRLIARNFGRSKSDNDQVAFDLRGPIMGGNFFAEDGGNCAKAAMRCRGGVTGDSSFGAQKSTIHGVHVKRNGSGYVGVNYGVLNQADFAEVTGIVSEGFTHGGAMDVVGVATAMQGAKLDLRAFNCTYGARVFSTVSAFELSVKSFGCDTGAYIEGDNGIIDVIGINSTTNHLRLVSGADNNIIRSRQYIGATPAGTGGNFRNDGTGNTGT